MIKARPCHLKRRPARDHHIPLRMESKLQPGLGILKYIPNLAFRTEGRLPCGLNDQTSICSHFDAKRQIRMGIAATKKSILLQNR